MKLPHRRQFLHLAAAAGALPAVSRVARAQDLMAATYSGRCARLAQQARSNRPPTVSIEFLWTRPLLAPRAVWHPLLSRYSSDREDMEKAPRATAPNAKWATYSFKCRAWGPWSARKSHIFALARSSARCLSFETPCAASRTLSASCR
jgi:hypothetical protein